MIHARGTQLTLDDVLSDGPPSHAVPSSRRAARAIKPVAKCLRERIYEFLDFMALTGGTIEEISLRLEIKQATVCGRISELKGGERKGHVWPVRIYDSGWTRKTVSGVGAIVWLAVKAKP